LQFRDLRVGAQVGLVFGVGLTLFIAVAAAVLIALGGIREAATAVYEATGMREAASDVFLQIVDDESAVRGYVATANPSFLDELQRSAQHIQADVPVLQIDAKTHGGKESDAADRVSAAVARAQTFFDDEIALVKAGNHTAALAHLSDERADFESLRSDVMQLAAYAEIHTADAQADQDDARSLLTEVIIIATAIAMLLFACMAILLGRRLGRRLGHVSAAIDRLAHEDMQRLTTAFTELAEGNLTATFAFDRKPLNVGGRDEIGVLNLAYNELVNAMNNVEKEFADATRRLRRALRGVLETSGDLSEKSVSMAVETETSTAAIERISRAFQEVAAGAQDQAYRIISASTSAEELSSSAGQIAQGASEQAVATRAATDSVVRLDQQIEALASLGSRLAAATRDAIAQANAGSGAVTRTSDALNSLRAVNSNTVDAMATLETRTAAVSEILGTIDEIAEQTNLLALNAAIEAARAGEHGRGFAVVAAEIRKLAERATGATREIAGILNAIRSETLVAVRALHSSTSRLEEGVEVAVQGNDAISRITDAVRDTAAVADEVADRSMTMRRESGSITQHIASVSAIVEENAAAATQMRETTNELSTQLAPVAVAAEEQSRTAEAISSSATDLTTQMQQMRGFAQLVQSGSETLRSLGGRFNVGETALQGTPEQPALTSKSTV
jgi:methyl-accepting chemotaxis protein